MAQRSSDLDILLQQVPVDDLAKQYGVDASTIESAVRQTLPALLGGMAVNASDPEGASRLVAATERHAATAAKPTLKAIDTSDGEKIVKHVLGDKESDLAAALGKQSGNSAIADLIPTLLPILAPIVMQFLAGKLSGKDATESAPKPGVDGVLGDLLGGLLGGGGTSSGTSQGGIGDVLGSVLGGGSASGSQGGLGGLLGGLFGK